MSNETENSGHMANIIYLAIYDSDPEIRKHASNALIAVFVYLAKTNDWTLENVQKEVEKAINYYYLNDPPQDI